MAAPSPLIQALKHTGPLPRAAMALMAVAVVTLGWAMRPVGQALLTPGLAVKDDAGERADSIRAYQEALAVNETFIIDRSAFFLPVDPRPRVVQRDPRPTAQPTQTRPPYGGPRFMGLVGNLAVFDRPVHGDRHAIAVGQTGGVLEVTGIEDVWHIRVRHGGHDYRLNLFDMANIPIMPHASMPTGAGPPAATGGVAPDIFGGAPAEGAIMFGDVEDDGTPGFSFDGDEDGG